MFISLHLSTVTATRPDFQNPPARAHAYANVNAVREEEREGE